MARRRNLDVIRIKIIGTVVMSREYKALDIDQRVSLLASLIKRLDRYKKESSLCRILNSLDKRLTF